MESPLGAGAGGVSVSTRTNIIFSLRILNLKGETGPQMTLTLDCGRRHSTAPQTREKEHYLGCSEAGDRGRTDPMEGLGIGIEALCAKSLLKLGKPWTPSIKAFRVNGGAPG